MRLATNFNLEGLKKSFESKLQHNDSVEQAIMLAIDEIGIELWAVRRYDSLVGELIFENVETGISKPECCFDNTYIGELFQEYVREGIAEKPNHDYIQYVKQTVKQHIIDNLKRIFSEQIGLAKLKVKPSGWQNDRISKYTVKSYDQWKKFLHRTIDIAHEETWIVRDENELIHVGKLHETYYGAMNGHDITFEAQTRAFRRLA